MGNFFTLILSCFFLCQYSMPAAAATVESAFGSHLSNVQVRDQGVVIRLLSDDNIGSRHQRFIIKMASKQTILIIHNMDLAPRINSIAKGDTIQFYGEYEWNYQGGIVHWTHADPGGRHINGWLKHRGRTYQ